MSAAIASDIRACSVCNFVNSRMESRKADPDL